MATLRVSCPWDRAQTHATLRRHLLEETYETLDVLDRIAAGDLDDDEARLAFEDLREELGDVLLQVVFHACIAAEAERFDLAAVAVGVRDKLIARHPAIFGTDRPVSPVVAAPTANEWEKAKVAEKGRGSVMDGIPKALPALAYATKVLAKSAAAAPRTLDGLAAGAPVEDEADLGRRLLELVISARRSGLDAEAALRTVSRDLEATVRAVEQSER